MHRFKAICYNFFIGLSILNGVAALLVLLLMMANFVNSFLTLQPLVLLGVDIGTLPLGTALIVLVFIGFGLGIVNNNAHYDQKRGLKNI